MPIKSKAATKTKAMSGIAGWMGLKDLTLGVDTVSLTKRPSMKNSIDNYLSQLGKLNGVDDRLPLHGTVEDIIGDTQAYGESGINHIAMEITGESFAKKYGAWSGSSTRSCLTHMSSTISKWV